MDWKWIIGGLEVDWTWIGRVDWIGGELQVDWRWIRSGLEVDSVKRVMFIMDTKKYFE